MALYKVEGLIEGNWDADYVGDPVYFRGEDEAQGHLEKLARLYEKPVSEFRIVEVQICAKLIDSNWEDPCDESQPIRVGVHTVEISFDGGDYTVEVESYGDEGIKADGCQLRYDHAALLPVSSCFEDRDAFEAVIFAAVADWEFPGDPDQEELDTSYALASEIVRTIDSEDWREGQILLDRLDRDGEPDELETWYFHGFRQGNASREALEDMVNQCCPNRICNRGRRAY